MCAKRRRINKGRLRYPAPKTLPDDLYDYDNDPGPTGATRHCNTPLLSPDGQRMHITDDWPENVPVTEAEIQVFERWFGDVFDELLSPKRPQEDLLILSHSDNKIP